MRSSAPFDDARRFAWLRLWRSENIGPRTFVTLLTRFGSAEAALDAVPALMRERHRGRSLRIADPADIEREFEAARRIGARFICLDEPDYPALLRQIDSPPAVIAVRGRSTILDQPAIAIVGSRNASAAGLAFTERLGRELGAAGYVIVSGFARGIDSRAHRATLASGTIAVLPGGHDQIYPADQAPFMEKLLEDGAALSEMPFGWEARGRDFPRRNRLVSGLALGTVVVEAARRSGSLITARFAADQGREVFAVPGSPLDPRAEGTNDLIRDGATFCTSAEDIICGLADRTPRRSGDDLFSDSGPRDDLRLWDEVDLDGDFSPQPTPCAQLENRLAFREMEPVEARPGDDERAPLAQVAERLGPTPISLDELARSVELPIGDVRAAVLKLEIAGRIERHGGGLVSLIMP